ncbi:hypothetical protein P344_00755 [Spiroplasma mirum ATCC 29335]|uniref:HAD family hydrolase n=1 Tax=Spiroplasma mirum ATCC 29335 TaxID=838561 RepID=W0GK36_9MOLU|nr:MULTISPECIES: Cof-type HAD-IIB family hydrolase [Spiroplasma]AHF60590.1 putative HAD superfamily hydrolase [Spiroplasma mirum ATCC 29335]AHI57524.1 hypothetical protein P344_00755 [Spiroplasma mirum ATCC 29335]AKM52708.1 HAD superfamily hydrolase [Spiroplasma atrichopogonis]
MAYKLIALDLDGTTVKRKNKISKQNVKTIKWALQNDIKIIIATGRSIKAIKTVADKLGVINYDLPVIGFNGGVIYDFLNNRIIKQNSFLTAEVQDVFRIANKNKVQLWAYSVKDDDLAYVNTNRGLMVKWMSWHTKRKRVLYNKVANFNDEVFKFVVSGNRPNVLAFKEEILAKYQFNIFDWSYVSKSKLNLEVSPLNTDKKDAVEYIAKMYDIKQEEVIAMGDGSNDREMLKWAGLGIAMGNAKQDIKNIANEVTHHHKKSGVAKAIKKHLNNK